MADDVSFSSQAVREFHNALTTGSLFGVPRYTTVLLPSVISNQGALAWDTTTNTLKGCNGSSWANVGSGDLAGPGSSTDNAIVRFDGTGGKTIQNSLAIADDLGNLTLPAGTATTPAINLKAGSQIGFFLAGAGQLSTNNPVAHTTAVQLWKDRFSLRQACPIFWSSINTDISGIDTGLTPLTASSAGILRVNGGDSTQRYLMGGGAPENSSATLGNPNGIVRHITGTTTITNMNAGSSFAGAIITLIFDGILTFTDGNNLKLAGNFVTAAGYTITLACDGTSWFEMGRSTN